MLCPGSLALCREHPEDYATRDAEIGTRVHKLIEDHLLGTRAVVEGEGPDAKIAADILRKAAPVVAAWRDLYPSDVERVYVEERFWNKDQWSAKVDAAFVRPYRRSALILDWKSGWGDTTPSHSNIQLMAQAATLGCDKRFVQIDSISVAVVQAHRPTPLVVEYDYQGLRNAFVEIERILAVASAPGVARIPGAKQCTFCPAKVHCPEVKQDMAQLTTVEPKELSDPVAIAHLLERCTMADKVIDAIREKAKSMARMGIEIPGYRLVPNTREKVSNIFGIWEKIQGYTTPDYFAKRCTLTKKDLEEMVEELRPDLKGKKRDAYLRTLLEGNTELVTGNPKLLKK